MESFELRQVDGLELLEPALVVENGVDPWRELRRELDRSRRYGRHFALVRIPGDDVEAQAPGRLLRRGRRGTVSSRASAVARVLRSVDSVWCHAGSVYLLLPETDGAGAVALTERMRRETPELVPATDVEIVAFPENGLTGGALLAALDRSPKQARPSLAGAYSRLREFGEQGAVPEAVNA